MRIPSPLETGEISQLPFSPQHRWAFIAVCVIDVDSQIREAAGLLELGAGGLHERVDSIVKRRPLVGIFEETVQENQHEHTKYKEHTNGCRTCLF